MKTNPIRRLYRAVVLGVTVSSLVVGTVMAQSASDLNAVFQQGRAAFYKGYMEQAKLLHALGLKPSPKMQAAAAPPSGDMGILPGPPSLMPPRMDDAGVAVPPNELARRFKSGGMTDIPTEKLMSAFIETGAKDQEIMAELVKRLSGPQPGM